MSIPAVTFSLKPATQAPIIKKGCMVDVLDPLQLADQIRIP
jgi:hypothetical protein